MQRFLTSVALLLFAQMLFPSRLPAQEKTAWSLYASTEGKCEILFPGKPKVQSDKYFSVASLEVQPDKAGYLLSFNGIAATPRDKQTVKRILDGGREGMTKANPGCKIVRETDRMIGGNPARDIEMETANGTHWRARLILAPRTMYQIVAFGPKDFVQSDAAKKFQDSFKLKATPKATP